MRDPANALACARLRRLLEFFGESCRETSPIGFREACDGVGVGTKLRVFASAAAALELFSILNRDQAQLRVWQEWCHSMFVFGGSGLEGVREVLKSLSKGADPVLLAPTSRRMMISKEHKDICGVMSGVDCMLSNLEGTKALGFAGIRACSLITSDAGPVFAKFEHEGVPVLVAGTDTIMDIDAELTGRGFDVRNHFLAAVPVVMFIKWAWAGARQVAPEANACLIIDDPLLRPSYGYVDYRQLMKLMRRFNFSTNIAFIPWNWSRSDRLVVNLFREHPELFSLSVHGCDHTKAEFGCCEKPWLALLASVGLERMARHEALTGIKHDRVMVFPQGVFSGEAPSVLKQSGYTAIVNSEVLTAGAQSRPIRVSAYWDVAVMDYDCFPIFTRRYPTDGTANFAFDILLGKPCLMLIHHDYCWDGCAQLTKAIQELNQLNCRLHWRGLGEVVSRSCRMQQVESDKVEIEMYGSELRLENDTDQPRSFLVRKREPMPTLVADISTEAGPVEWFHADGVIQFAIRLDSHAHQTVRVQFHPISKLESPAKSLTYRFKTAVRRYLCEARDNYIVKLKYFIRPPAKA